MKRVVTGFLLLLSLALLAGCQAEQPPEQVQSEKAGKSAAAESSAPGETSGESRAALAKPFRGERAASQEPETPNSVGEDSPAGYVGMTYRQLAEAYGSSEIYHWFELGLYSNFDAAQITVLFDFEMIHPYYSDVSLWLEEPGEFIFSDSMDPVYNFETGRFRPSDFEVAVVSAWGDSLKRLLDELGIESPATLEMLNDSFGQVRTAQEEYLFGWFEAGPYSRGDYQYRFIFDNGSRYVTSAWIQPAGDGAYTSDVRTMWCDGVQPDREIIWLTEPTSHGEMDGGGGSAYPLAPPLVTLCRTAPPQEGELYSVSFSDDGVVMALDRVEPPLEGDVFYVLWLYEEIQQLIQQGMTPLAEMERVFVDGNLCYTAALGTNRADHFVRERHFAVDVENWLVYEYDVLTDSYAPLGVG